MNKNLATQNQNDITITESGDAFISQRKLEELLGVNDGTVRKHLSRHHPEAKTDKGLSADLVEVVTMYYAFDTANPTDKAKEFAKMLMKAGAKAYLYHEAGFQMEAVKVPRTFQEALRLAADIQDELDRKNVENLKLTEQVEDLQIELDQSTEWMSVKKVAAYNNVHWRTIKWHLLKKHGIQTGNVPYKVFDANYPEGVNVYHKDSWRAVYPALIVPGDEF